jgi:hypothetical protein
MFPGEMQGFPRMIKAFWRTESGFFLGIWVFFMVVGRDRLFRDPGTFWHTVVGRRILSSGHFLETDPFSFTCAGKPWIPHQWLGECLMGALDGIGGLDMLLLTTATVLAALYTWVAHRLLRCGLHWLPTVFLTMLTIAASANHLHVRPHISTIAFLGLTFGWLCDFETGRIGLGRFCWLIPLDWIWSNMHGGVVGGLLTMALAVGGWSGARLLGLDSPIVRPRQAFFFFLIIAACALLIPLNPYGLRLPGAWLEIMRSPVVARLIEEHAALDFRGPVGWLVLFLGLIYVGTLASVRPWRPRVTWLIPLFWLYETVTRVRHSPLFSITAVLAMAEMLPYTRLAALLARPGRDLFQLSRVASGQWSVVSEDGRTGGQRAVDSGSRSVDSRGALIPVGLVLLALLLQAAGVRAPIVGHGWVKLDHTHWPVELLPELRQAEQDHPEGSRIFNDLLYGGFLIYYAPSLKIFIDDRCELYGDDLLMRFSEAMQSNPQHIDRWQELYGFPYALVATGTPFDHYLGQARRWTLVKQMDTAALYKLKSPGADLEKESN